MHGVHSLIIPNKSFPKLFLTSIVYFIYCRKVLLSKNYFNYILARNLAYYIYFSSIYLNKSVNKVVIPDSFSPEYVGILGAFKIKNFKLQAFRITHTPKRFNPPFLIDIIYCKNSFQIKEKNLTRDKVLIKSIIASKIRLIDTAKSKYEVGIVLGSKYNIKIVVKYLKSLSQNNKYLYNLRLHPSVTPSNNSDIYNFFQSIILGKSSLYDFTKKNDFVIVGNSSAAIELKNLGSCVIYTEKLDDHIFDFHGWIKSGYIYHVKDKLIDINDINNFYRN